MTGNLSLFNFPPSNSLESEAVLRSLVKAHRHLAELKGEAKTIPNVSILIDTLVMQEAKDSSDIENIVTTHDELFKSQHDEKGVSPAAKEVQHYGRALKYGYNRVKDRGFIELYDLLYMQALVVTRKTGLRTRPGTVIANSLTGEEIYRPPQDSREIEELTKSLIEYINLSSSEGFDPLVKMALIHHQFESIHPFYDGNGRVGRILNILYLVAQGLLDYPILYLSRFITKNKSDYYQLLQNVRDEGDWEKWILFMLDGIALTSKHTLDLVKKIVSLMLHTKHRLRGELPNIYSQDLINNIFRYPYTRIEILRNDLRITRPTANKYLNQMEEFGFLTSLRTGRNIYYINQPLCDLLMDAGEK